MKLNTLFDKGQFVVTSEVGPPKGINLKKLNEELSYLKGVVDAVNVTDNQSAVMRMGSLAVCAVLKKHGIEPVFQLTCRDRNRLALQSDLLSAAALGIKNVLCLTGDHVILGDHPQAKPVYDLDSVQLLEAAKRLSRGKDLNGNILDGAPDFCLGAVADPGADLLELHLIKLKKKIEAGASFIQTQAVFDIEVFSNFMEKINGYNIPVMAGIILLKSAKMARFMNKYVSGVHVPEPLISELERTPKEKLKDKSVEIAKRLVSELKQICQGVHIMPLGWNDLIPKICQGGD